MLQLDDVQLYELSEAGSRLFSDPHRLARLARLRRVPAAQIEGALGLPVPWVEAESGTSGADPESLATYWLERLAPPASSARRPRRDRDRLPASELLDAEQAAGRLYASPAALARLDLDGTLPGLRVEGAALYDAELVDLVAREDEGDEARDLAEVRRAAVRGWARYEYATPDASAVPLAQDGALQAGLASAPGPSEANTEEAAPAPAAFEIPADLDLSGIQPLTDDLATPPRPSDLIEADGFETIDED